MFATNFVEHFCANFVYFTIFFTDNFREDVRAGAEAEVPERATAGAEAVLLADARAELHPGPA